MNKEYNRPGYESMDDEQIEQSIVGDLVLKALENPYGGEADYVRANARLNAALVEIDRKLADARRPA